MSVIKPRIQITPEITVQPPLSRRGTGPGLILVVPSDLDLGPHEQTLDPPPLQKWAEESFAVAQIILPVASDGARPGDISDRITTAVEALGNLPDYCCSPSGKVGVIGNYAPTNQLVPVGRLIDVTDTMTCLVLHADLSTDAASAIQNHPSVAAAIFYGHYPTSSAKSSTPTLVHLPSNTPVPTHENIKSYTYPNLTRDTPPYFTVPSHPAYNASAASVSHTRSLTFLKPLLGGPYFDLEKIWDEHTRYEFADRSVEETMATMVDEPYVNHVPTLTGGVGRASLTRFYADHFIFSNPEDARLELVSRTVGIDRIVDEFLFECTHNRTIDWL